MKINQKIKEIYISENNKRALCTKYGALFFIDGEDGICKYICENDFRGSILFLLNDGDEISECFRNMTFIGYDKNLNFLFIPLKTNQAVEIYDLKKIELIKSFNVLENYLEELEPECYIGFLISDREDYDLHIFYLACSSGKIECEFYYNINENHFIEIEQSKLKKKSDENANLVYELTLEEEKQIKIGQDLYDEQMLKNK